MHTACTTQAARRPGDAQPLTRGEHHRRKHHHHESHQHNVHKQLQGGGRRGTRRRERLARRAWRGGHEAQQPALACGPDGRAATDPQRGRTPRRASSRGCQAGCPPRLFHPPTPTPPSPTPTLLNMKKSIRIALSTKSGGRNWGQAKRGGSQEVVCAGRDARQAGTEARRRGAPDVPPALPHVHHAHSSSKSQLAPRGSHRHSRQRRRGLAGRCPARW